MSRTRHILMGILGVVVIGGLVTEYGTRHMLEARYREAVQSRRQLALQYGELLASQQQLKQALKHEQAHSKELSDTLASTQTELERIANQLAEETQTVRELHGRLAAVHQQMDQLQGELAVTLENRPSRSANANNGPVQLDRIVVSDAASPSLEGRVLSVHRDWNFVVVDLGWNAVRVGDTISILRRDQLLARARVDRVQEGICAATILPEWAAAEIQVDDLARVL